MGNKLVLLGGGGHCKSVIDAVKRSGKFEYVVITDPKLAVGTDVLGFKIVGTDECIKRLRTDGFEHAFITVGSIGLDPLRERMVNTVMSLEFKFPVIIDTSAAVSVSAVIGAGTFIGKNAVVNADVKIGEHCIINTGAVIEHECQIDDFSHISVGSILCGEVKVGRNSFIGAGTTVIQGKNIGNNVVIGANSTVLGDVEDNMKCYGVITNRGGYSIRTVNYPSFMEYRKKVA